jgi:polysaccharide export outer membrane protein
MRPLFFSFSRVCCLPGLLLSVVLSSCTFLPSSGPSLYRVKKHASKQHSNGDYVLIPVTQRVLDVLSGNGSQAEVQRDPRLSPQSLSIRRLFRQGTPELLGGKPSDLIVQGDVVKVTIFDSGGSLFATPIMPNGMTQTGAIPHELPPQIVDNSGEIMVPYAGRIMARGRSAGQVQDEIQSKLKGKTVDPQVVVTVAERKGGDCVTILGDVKAPSRVQISLAGTRLLDAIAQAGGSTGKEYETMVSVNRGGTTRATLLSEIFDTPSKNIFLQFGDSIVMRVRGQNFLSFGANGRVAEIPFDDDHLTMAKAMGKMNGLDDNAADPSSVLLYRMEPRGKIEEMGGKPAGDGDVSPVIYRLDLTKPDGFFLARNFVMRDHDILYTTPAGSVGVNKFMRLLGSLFTPVSQASGATLTAGAAAGALGGF